jgi:hypothetical protein
MARRQRQKSGAAAPTGGIPVAAEDPPIAPDFNLSDYRLAGGRPGIDAIAANICSGADAKNGESPRAFPASLPEFVSTHDRSQRSADGRGLALGDHAAQGPAVEIDRALATANEHGGRLQLSEMLRLKGELMSMVSRRAEAEACLRQSIAIAERQGAKLPKLRSALSLARLLADKSKPREARAVLQPAYDAVTEGFDLTDLKAAAGLLAGFPNR